MLSNTFLKLFPPPVFLKTSYAGLDISDDAVRCIEYSSTSHGLTIHKYVTKTLAPGTIVEGEIRDASTLSATIGDIAREMKIHAVKASLPEEKMYLFKTEVPSTNTKEIRQNIEFKLEENVPLAPAEALFYFNTIPTSVVKATEGSQFVSVSVAPRTLVMSYLDAIRSAGLTVLSFEVQAKAIARSIIPHGSTETDMIVNIMDHKTGVYIVCAGAVCFTSTIPWGNKDKGFDELKKQITQVETYWAEHGFGTAIDRIIFSGKGALVEGLTSGCSSDASIPVEIGNTWQNAFSHTTYIPPITYEDSLDYAVSAGLALPS